MSKAIGYQLRALGRTPMPAVLEGPNGCGYRLVRTFKHDFFAGTGLYAPNASGGPGGGGGTARLVLKIGRRADLLGIPLAWLGEALVRHEVSVLRRLQGLPGVPELLGPWRRQGLLYRYIEGDDLDQRPRLPDDFFDRLDELVAGIHARQIAYVDLNKRGNILLGADGRPHLLDFQIALYLPDAVWPLGRLLGGLRRLLQREDRYHLAKHKRQLRPDLMTEAQRRQARRISPWIALHRMCTRPLTLLRRRVLALLHRRGQLALDEGPSQSAETDPRRWHKKVKPGPRQSR